MGRLACRRLTSVDIHLYDTIFNGSAYFLLRRAGTAVEDEETGYFKEEKNKGNDSK